jgi:hypothetical protein
VITRATREITSYMSYFQSQDGCGKLSLLPIDKQ